MPSKLPAVANSFERYVNKKGTLNLEASVSFKDSDGLKQGYIGFETGGTEEGTPTDGPEVSSSGTPRTGSYHLREDDDERFGVPTFVDGASDGGADYVVGFAIKHVDATPNTTITFAKAKDTVGTGQWWLQLTTAGTLQLVDSQSTGKDSYASAFTDNTWHYLEVSWDNTNSGYVYVYLDGEEVMSTSDADTDTAGNSLQEVELRNAATSYVYFDDFYFKSGCSGTSDFMGGVEVFGYQSGNSTGTSDAGDNLDQNEWNDTAYLQG